ncbi:head-tail adaptor protein [Radiobacillus kanasensis]|uniref:head-tail adaptor protein n=1 Tax=Radiobacillus kanasensis TaxID=2844358 RepID=UPI001E51C1CE|nr:head-tail adaptor protein [Radiobacillus kanasensis]UFU00366.1 head-tail adaptor protein [Radiobacillus kanasensis]
MQRRIQKPVHEVFNDGFLEYGKVTVQRNDARKKIGDAFVPEGKLAYQLMNAREEDIQLAGAMNSRLDMKVKTRFPPSFKTNRKKSSMSCKVHEIIYDVIDVDWDKSRSYLFFYLQEVGEAQ